MKHISDNIVLTGSSFREAYKRFLLESNERKRNALFNKVLPTIDKQIAYVFSYLKITEPDLQDELMQLSHIKVYTKITLQRIFDITNLNGYIRNVIINTIRDYFKASNNYNKHRREFKMLVNEGIETYGKQKIMASNETPQSEFIIKPIR